MPFRCVYVVEFVVVAAVGTSVITDLPLYINTISHTMCSTLMEYEYCRQKTKTRREQMCQHQRSSKKTKTKHIYYSYKKFKMAEKVRKKVICSCCFHFCSMKRTKISNIFQYTSRSVELCATLVFFNGLYCVLVTLEKNYTMHEMEIW